MLYRQAANPKRSC